MAVVLGGARILTLQQVSEVGLLSERGRDGGRSGEKDEASCNHCD